MWPVYRQDILGTPCAYPRNLLRTMAPTMYQFRRVIGGHFARRHSTSTPANVRMWIKAYRKDLHACGWNMAARQVNQLESKGV